MERDGIYPDTGLLSSWPAGGPELLWYFEGLGQGHGSVSFGKDRVFVLGMPDTMGVLYAFSLKGDLLWQQEYGPEWHTNFKGPRSTPTVVGHLVYFLSGQGVVYCYDGRNGKLVWAVDMQKEFDAPNITWGFTESLLVDGDRLYCTPGGPVHNVVCLNRHNGETIWTSRAMAEPSAYCSPALIIHNGTRLVVTHTTESIFALDALTGQMYWSFPQRQLHKIHANTPIYWQGHIISSSDYERSDNGLVSIALSNDGKSATVAWRNQGFTNLMGGIVLVDGHIYGSEYRKSGWSVLDAQTGQLVHKADTLGNGVIIWADNRMYLYTEEGIVALVDAGPNHFTIEGSFSVPKGTDEHWAHPVIHRSRLYVRHGNALMVYNLQSTAT